MDYQFREIRKGECPHVLDFAAQNGCTIEPGAIRHPLSLMVKADDDIVAIAACVEPEPAHFIIEIVHKKDLDDVDLLTELADRCLRKMQSEGIALARLQSPTEDATQSLWKQTNWLDRIDETPPPIDPPEEVVDEPQKSQAA